MFKPFLLLLSLLLTAAVPAWANPQISASAAAEIMIPDGVLNESCYKTANWYELSYSNQPVPQKTSFAVLRTTNGLWFAFQAIDREIVCNKKEDDGPLWADDCLEIFLMPEQAVPEDPNAREFYHFIFNTGGFRYDARNFGGVNYTSWGCSWQAAVKTDAQGFSAEVFIPYAGMNLYDNETVWRINVGREDRLQQKTWLSSLVKCRTFNECTAFARLHNAAPDFRRFNVKSVKKSIDMAGSNSTPHPVLTAQITAAPRREFYLTGVLRPPQGSIAALSNSTVESDAAGKLNLQLKFPAVPAGNYQIEYSVADKLGTVFCDSFEHKINTLSWQLNWINPVYRNTLFASQTQRSVSFDIKQLSEDTSLDLTVKLLNQANEVVFSSNWSGGLQQRVDIPINNLLPGQYTVQVADKKNMLCEKITLLPPQDGNEVTVDAHGRLLVNGKKFFPRGFLGGNYDLSAHLQAGSNLIHFYELHRQNLETIREVLDKCHAAGLKVIMTPAYRTNMGFWGIKNGNKYRQKFTPQDIENLKYMVNHIKSHPALLAWYLYDEPRGAAWCAELKRVYELMRQIDPAHPVVGLDNSAGGVIDKQSHCDIALLDIYANPFVNSKPARSIAMITAGSAAVVNALERGKALWQCPQAYDNDSFQKKDFKRERRAPTYTETRATVFGAIAAGANGILPYKIGNAANRYFIRNGNAGIFADPELKIGYLNGIMPELAVLEPVLLSDNVFMEYSGDLLLRAYQYGAYRFVVAANVKESPTVMNLHWDNAQSVRVLGEKRILHTQGGKISDHFAPLAVHIYTDSPDFPDTPEVEAIKKQIAVERESALQQLPPEVKDKQ